MRKTLFTGIFTLLLLAAGAAGQETRDEPGCASDAGRKLDFLIGDWQVTSKYRVGSDPDRWEKTDGRASLEHVFGGCLVRERLETERGGRPLTVIALYSYNNISDKYQWLFAHSEHGVLSLFEGGLEKGVFTLKNSLEVRGRVMLFERVLRETKNGFEMIARRSFDGGKTWRDDWFLSYRRLKRDGN